MNEESCDCLNRCGDDYRVLKGEVRSCWRFRQWFARARIRDVRRDATDPRALVVIYDKPPHDDDLRALRYFDRWPNT